MIIYFESLGLMVFGVLLLKQNKDILDKTMGIAAILMAILFSLSQFLGYL